MLASTLPNSAPLPRMISKMPKTSAEHVLSKEQLTALLSEVVPPRGAQNRRKKDRRTFSCPMTLVPFDVNGSLLVDKPVRVAGIDLSSTGIRFTHECPLFGRRAVITFEHPKAGRLAVEVAVLWTEANNAGLYESGCQMIRKAGEHTLGS